MEKLTFDAAIRGATDSRLVRILHGLDKRVGPTTRQLRELILTEMGRRIAAAYASEQRRLRASLRAKRQIESDYMREFARKNPRARP
jgi:hypothetical protein